MKSVQWTVMITVPLIMGAIYLICTPVTACTRRAYDERSWSVCMRDAEALAATGLVVSCHIRDSWNNAY
jgi:hypothetical protein